MLVMVVSRSLRTILSGHQVLGIIGSRGCVGLSLILLRGIVVLLWCWWLWIEGITDFGYGNIFLHELKGGKRFRDDHFALLADRADFIFNHLLGFCSEFFHDRVLEFCGGCKSYICACRFSRGRVGVMFLGSGGGNLLGLYKK
jgi:hypothetical protein